jgi:CCR4-NOT transcription complex subunit 2
MSSLGFGPQAIAAADAPGGRGGNGLLNALSANSRTADARSPVGRFARRNGPISDTKEQQAQDHKTQGPR